MEEKAANQAQVSAKEFANFVQSAREFAAIKQDLLQAHSKDSQKIIKEIRKLGADR